MIVIWYFGTKIANHITWYQSKTRFLKMIIINCHSKMSHFDFLILNLHYVSRSLWSLLKIVNQFSFLHVLKAERSNHLTFNFQSIFLPILKCSSSDHTQADRKRRVRNDDQKRKYSRFFFSYFKLKNSVMKSHLKMRICGCSIIAKCYFSVEESCFVHH
jgi:hypothetical protein